MIALKSALLRLRYRWSLQVFIGELLGKRWMEAIIPFLLLASLIIVFASNIDGYLSPSSIAVTLRAFAEFGFVALAMALVIISGGIDLSPAAMFGLSNCFALIFFQMLQWPVALVIVAVLAFGAFMGAINGFMIGYMKTRAFLTTLVTLIIFRSIFALLDQNYSAQIAYAFNESDFWEFLGDGKILGMPTNVTALFLVALIGQILLTRSRPGSHLTAIGGGRRAARHAGIAIQRTMFFTYVISGLLSAMGGLFYAARLNSATSDVGGGWEIMALTAVVLGGVSLSGGKGTAGRALMGALAVMILTNGLLSMGILSSVSSALLGLILVLAVGIDIKWLKNLQKTIQKIYVVPSYLKLPEAPDTRPGSGNVFEANNRLKNAEAIGLNQIDGPEDVIVDREGRVYGSARQGWIVRFSGENFSKREIFARTGGRPLGMAFDRDDNLIVCVGGMGLYGVRPDGEVYKITDETNRTWYKINDDSRLRLTDDCDIAPDGKIYFSEATIRYEMHSWYLDGLEARGNGRLVCYDPVTQKTRTIIRNISFPNGICLAHDAQSILFAQTWLCRVMRLWIAGPKKGKVEPVVDNMPFYPDNVNRSSDGNYWLASVGIRSPVFDLAMRSPGFRVRMYKTIPPDEWIFHNINIGCVSKFNENGEVLETLWDFEGQSHPTITSMREHLGYLYIAGLFNNRIGRIKIEGADPNWIGPESYWGKKQ